MPWQDRTIEAAYTSPSGTRITFHYENVSREVSLRGTAFEFPGVDGTYIQQSGHSSRRYPMRCIFWGFDHDLLATAFEARLLEKGIGRLQHPLYGVFDVVPFGDFTRRDDLKDAANQTIIEVTFWATIRNVYPTPGTNPRNEILTETEDFDVVGAQKFIDSMDLGTAIARANSRGTIRQFLLDASATLDKVSQATLAVTREFREIQSTVNLGLDVFVGQPLQIAQQIANLIKAPGRALSGILSRLDAYAAFAERIFDSVASNPAETLTSGTAVVLLTTTASNNFHTADLFASNAVAGSVVAATHTDTVYESRVEAIAAAERVRQIFDDWVEWRDAGYAALADVPKVGTFQVDTGEVYDALQRMVTLAEGYLVELSFSLVPERRIVLDRPRTIVDLAGELYGTVDSKLDALINGNNLTGDEIIELPRGKRIKYYSAVT